MSAQSITDGTITIRYPLYHDKDTGKRIFAVSFECSPHPMALNLRLGSVAIRRTMGRFVLTAMAKLGEEGFLNIPSSNTSKTYRENQFSKYCTRLWERGEFPESIKWQVGKLPSGTKSQASSFGPRELQIPLMMQTSPCPILNGKFAYNGLCTVDPVSRHITFRQASNASVYLDHLKTAIEITNKTWDLTYEAMITRGQQMRAHKIAYEADNMSSTAYLVAKNSVYMETAAYQNFVFTTLEDARKLVLTRTGGAIDSIVPLAMDFVTLQGDYDRKLNTKIQADWNKVAEKHHIMLPDTEDDDQESQEGGIADQGRGEEYEPHNLIDI